MLQAIGNKVIIKPDKKETETKSGIFLPESQVKNPTGIVVSVGEEVTVVKVGQRVMYAKWEQMEVKYEGNTYFIFECTPDKIKAVIE